MPKEIKDSSKYDYYAERISSVSFDNLVYQVGKTYLDKTITKKEFIKIVKTIYTNLSLNTNDNVLDLGCANGLITYNISKKVNNIIGFDINDKLLEIAKNNLCRDNIEYIKSNILDIDFSKYEANKYFMYAVIQYIDYKDFRRLIKNISKNKESFSLLICDIPDNELLLKFYHTKDRKKFLFEQIIENNKQHIGNWWYKEHLEVIAESLGLNILFLEQDKTLHTAHYRFDCRIYK